MVGSRSGERSARVALGTDPLTRALHIFVFWGFGVAQPLLELLGRNAQFFVARDSGPAEVVGLALALCILFPALIVLGEWALGRISRAVGRAFHRALITLLAAASISPLLKALDTLPEAFVAASALAFGVATVWACERFAAIRTYLAILAPAPLVFAAAFLFFSPAGELIRSPSQTMPLSAVDVDLPIVLVIFDELSLPTLMDGSHRIDALRYPNFATLAGASHWFRNATTPAAGTAAAVPAILTGKYPQTYHQAPLPTAGHYPKNLFTLLGGSYRMNVIEPVTELCPDEICAATPELPPATRAWHLAGDVTAVYLHRVLPIDLASRLPPVDDQWGGFGLFEAPSKGEADDAGQGDDPRPATSRKVRDVSAFRAALSAHSEARDAGHLHFLHSGLPHVPWRFLPSGKSYGTTGDRLLGRSGISHEHWGADPWPVLQGFQRYLLQLGFVDRLLGDLLQTLEEAGLYDRALVIVTADHGVSFRPGSPRRRVDAQTFADIMSVPLFIKLPHQREGVLSDRNVELIDILPTIVEILGLQAPWRMDGISVFDDVAPVRPAKLLFQSGGSLSFDAAEMDAKYQTVERMMEVFAPSSDPFALYRIGPFPDLLGRRLTTLEVETEPRAKVLLKSSKNFHHVDLATGFVPARVIGSIPSKDLEQRPVKLAVAIGGTVWATTYVRKSKAKRSRFSAIVPEEAFSNGRNRVEVFIVEGTSRPRLFPTLSPGA